MSRGAFLLLTAVCLAAPPAPAAGPARTSGIVDRVQIVRAPAAEAADVLILSLADGRHFHLPGRERLSAGPGFEVSLRYLPAAEGGEMPVACRVRVLGVPIERDGQTRLERAERPFEVYRNNEPAYEC